MKRYRLAAVVAVFVLAAVVAQDALAFEADVSGSVTWVSKYIWRGQDLLPDDEAAVQPGISMAFGNGVGVSLWGSYGLDGDPALDEFDYTFSYTSSLSDRVGYSLGVTYYTFPSANHQESAEGFAALSFPKAFFSPAVSIYGDWESGEGIYVFLGGSHEWPVKGTETPMKLKFSAGVGYSDGFWGTEPGIADVDLGLSLAVDAGGGVTLTPSVNYVFTPEDNANTENEFWGGVGLSFGL